MGGYKAGRLAQFDGQLKAVIANAPMLHAGKVLATMKKIPKLGKGACDWALRTAWQYGIDIDRPAREVGEILIELQVETTPEELRRVVSGIPGPKRVVLENGPLSAMIHDTLDGVAEQAVSCDPTRNALVSRSDSSNDRLDARCLGILDRAGATHEARTILFVACAIWKSGKEYDDAKVGVPKTEDGAR